ncbi:MAG TPA: hypothetical protein VMU08_12690 [Rhizomicrobium sp.]|nr:hypothetical protein [Rhizomicrobium sp.]
MRALTIVLIGVVVTVVALFVYAFVLHRVCGPDFDIFDGLWC